MGPFQASAPWHAAQSWLVRDDTRRRGGGQFVKLEQGDRYRVEQREFAACRFDAHRDCAERHPL
jgi:hypothetical protein